MTDAEFRDAVQTYELVCRTYNDLVSTAAAGAAHAEGPRHPLWRAQAALEIAICDAERRLVQAIGRGRTRVLGRTRYAVVRKAGGWCVTETELISGTPNAA